MVGNDVKDIKLEVSKDMTEFVRKEFRNFEKESLLIGIPEDETIREQTDAKITNAQLLFIHTKGSPANNIPKRPVIEPAIENKKEKIIKKMDKITKLFADGKNDEAKYLLRRLGDYVVGVCKSWFQNDDNGWLPDKPATIKRKKSDRTLIDTGQMRNAITYVIEGRHGRTK